MFSIHASEEEANIAIFCEMTFTSSQHIYILFRITIIRSTWEQVELTFIEKREKLVFPPPSSKTLVFS